MKAGIVLDAWKLPIFEKHLKKDGFTWKQTPGPTADLLLLTIITDNHTALAATILAANTEAARSKQTLH